MILFSNFALIFIREIDLKFSFFVVLLCGLDISMIEVSWWDCKLVQPLWKSVWWFLRKLDIFLPGDPAITLLGIYPEDVPTVNKDT